ncbi:MAG: NERD domain-containing protein [Clostridia bacterium]|nr:NERD domain-containing protein [Clostridia bacterium]
MEDIRQVYKQLTAVDIEKQRKLWDERGKGYYGEFQVLKYLYQNITGNCKILMNLQIPTPYNTLTEIDLLMIHETGIYVFEIKHYKGRIYGTSNKPKWTQYFRTAPNHTFDSPVGQNSYHIQALKRLIPNENFYSLIVFTHEDCVLKIENLSTDLVICKLDELHSILNEKISKLSAVYTMENIDQLFQQLAKYSPMSNEIQLNDLLPEAPLYTYFEQLKVSLDDAVTHAKNTEKQHKKAFWISLTACILTATLVICGCLKYCNAKITEAEAQLNEFAQNFKHVDEIDNPYVKAVNSIVTISSIELNISDSLENTVTFRATLSVSGADYGIAWNENSQYIVITKDGKVHEYAMFGEANPFYSFSNRIGPPGSAAYPSASTLETKQFFGIQSPDDIAYIKIKNVSVWSVSYYSKMLHNDLELELYKSE